MNSISIISKYYFLAKRIFILFATACLLNSCIVKRVIKPGEYLYSGAKVQFHSDTAIEGKGDLNTALKNNFFPLPNSKTFGLPLKLWIYSVFYNSTHHGFRAYIADNYGEQPVYLSDVPVDQVKDGLQTVLKANGYLDSRIIAKNRKAGIFGKSRKMIYNCYLNPPYRIRNYVNNLDDTTINFFLGNEKKPLIKPNDKYNLAALQAERVQIDSILKKHGYYYFFPELILFLADSTIGNRKIDISMTFISDIDSSKLKPWFIKNIYVEDISDSTIKFDTVLYKNIHFITSKVFKPKYIRKFLLFNKGEILTYENFNVSNKNLSSEDAFKFTNIETEPLPGDSNLLNIHVRLIPNKRNNLKVEVDLVTKSNNFTGPGISISHLNRNMFGGAEEFRVKIASDVEFLLYKKNQHYLGEINYELSSNISLNFPRFLAFNPFFSPRHVPTTQFMAEGRIMQQIQYYRMSFLRFIYGYKWSETNTKKHELNLIDINFQHQLRSTNTFDSLVKLNPLLQQSFADQFFIGTSYIFQYIPEKNDRRVLKPAFTGTVEFDGNLLYAIQNLTGSRRTAAAPLRFFGTEYAEFVRTTADFRIYIRVSPSYNIALRMNGGIGVPAGNSVVLPVVKQFYLGGVDNLRAFRFRSVGPGGYAISGSSNLLFYNHTGDMLLLGSLENRIKVASHFEAALFIDAGNVWLLKEDPLRPKGKFDLANFYKQIASGWGYGLRYISDYFILRADIGVPIYSPNPLQPRSKLSWVFNLAIGYPF